MCGGLFTLFETQFGVKTRILYLKTKKMYSKKKLFTCKNVVKYIFLWRLGFLSHQVSKNIVRKIC